MTIHDLTIAKMQQLPESLAQEVSDFIDFLVGQTRPDAMGAMELL